ncbi:MAG: hypothetical protein J0L93_07955 [Deltaproteobacteria bacterium]|nr:hypothetical protein [Deltaproteobacteria bacterium]
MEDKASAFSKEKALSFSAPDLVQSFSQKNPRYSLKESEKLFEDLKLWLWACAQRTRDQESEKDVPPTLTISPELKNIDELWHHFLESPKEYKFFCEKYLGHTVEHITLTEEELKSFRHLCETNPEAARRARQDELRPQLEYLYDLLGPDVLRRWYGSGNFKS